MYIQRKIEARLQESMERPEILVVVGARQSGKTTLLQKLKATLEEKKQISFFINLENTRHLNLLNETPENLFKLTGNPTEKKIYVFIDEIQYLANPSNFLKYLYDEYKDKIKLIVSGSSAFYIDQKFTDSLAGRKRLFQLNLLDFREFLRFKNNKEMITVLHGNPLLQKKQIPGVMIDKLNNLLIEFVKFGAYPGVVLEKSDKEKKYLLEELLNSFLAKDVEIMGIKKKDKFYDLLRLLCVQVGSMVNLSELANTLKISVSAVDNYLYILEKSFQVKRIRPFYSNIRKELTKMPKLYFMDLGIRNVLLDTFDWMEFRLDKGMVMENLVFKFLDDREDVRHLNFWRTQDQKEVDFIINGQFALEVKFSGAKFDPGKYKLFRESYPNIPISAVCFMNPTPDNLTLFDLV